MEDIFFLPEGDECLPQAVTLFSLVFKCVHFDCMATGAVRNFLLVIYNGRVYVNLLSSSVCPEMTHAVDRI